MAIVRELQLDDYEAVCEFWRRNGVGIGSREQWARQWVGNPAIAGRTDQWPKGWLVEDDRKQVVGYLANIPSAYYLDEKRLSATTASDWLVEVPHRNYSMALASRFLHQAHVDLFLNSYASDVAARIFIALGAHPFPQKDMDRPMFAVLDYSRFGQSVLRKKGWPAARILGALAGQFLRVADNLSPRRNDNPREECVIRTITAFDDRFDAFWDRLRVESHRLLLNRSREALDFYFGDFLAKGLGWICVHERNSELMAYAVFVRKDNEEIGMKRCWLADLQCVEPGGHKEIHALLDLGLEDARARGMHVVESIGFCEGKRSLIAEHLPRQRKFPVWPFYYKASNPELAGKLENPELWDACIVDSVDGL